MKLYEGRLHLKGMDPVAFKGYQAWRCQRQRCNNPKDRSFKTWGAKGIKVEYSSREFIGWYLEEIKKFKGKDPIVGRIDHSKNYCFGNIRIEERSENSKEVRARTMKQNLIAVIDRSTQKTIAVVNGTGAAKRLTGINTGTIYRYLMGVFKPKTQKFDFKYVNAEVTY